MSRECADCWSCGICLQQSRGLCRPKQTVSDVEILHAKQEQECHAHCCTCCKESNAQEGKGLSEKQNGQQKQCLDSQQAAQPRFLHSSERQNVPTLSRASCNPFQRTNTRQSTAAAKPLKASRMPGSPSDSRHFSWMPLITPSTASPKASRAAAITSNDRTDWANPTEQAQLAHRAGTSLMKAGYRAAADKVVDHDLPARLQALRLYGMFPSSIMGSTYVRSNWLRSSVVHQANRGMTNLYGNMEVLPEQSLRHGT